MSSQLAMHASIPSLDATVLRLIAGHLEIDVRDLNRDTEIQSLPKADSMKMFEIILATENELKIELPDGATFGISTIGEYIDIVQTAMSQQNGAV